MVGGSCTPRDGQTEMGRDAMPGAAHPIRGHRSEPVNGFGGEKMKLKKKKKGERSTVTSLLVTSYKLTMN